MWRNVLPRTKADFACFLLIIIFIPVTFIFELAVVLPEFHASSSWLYRLTVIAGIFLIFNLKGNMLFCMLVDTSIKHEILTPPVQRNLRKLWRYCYDCETLAPPRSWHCQSCKTCILKRDHHCLFTGCCVGFRNHRYFLLFLLYIAIGSAYTTIYNSIYFWMLHADEYANSSTLIKMIFPMLMATIDVSWRNFYLLIYELNLIALAYSLVLIIFHSAIFRGAVCYERNETKYDLGWRRNLEMVLGKRMHLVWLSPFITSELPHDGIHWETILQKSSKNR